MKARIEYGKASPEARRAMHGLVEYLDQSGAAQSAARQGKRFSLVSAR